MYGLINVSLVGDREIVAKLDAMPTVVRAVLGAKIQALTINLQAHIIDDKLHGQVLHQRSGALARSIQEEAPINDGETVYGRVYSAGDVKYAAIHEYGGTIPAHDIVPNKAQALAFTVGGKLVFAKIVHMPPVTMPQRSFMRSALADQAAEISLGLKTAAAQGMNQSLGHSA